MDRRWLLTGEGEMLPKPYTTLFYLAKANYAFAEVFEEVDFILTPSAALSAHYRALFGLDSEPLGPFIDLAWLKAVETGPVVSDTRDCVLFINPSPEKGLGLALALARRAREVLPETRFLFVEGRWRAADLAARFGIDWGRLTNVHWLENQADMRPVYARARVLLYQSLCFEGFGRSVLEAMHNGVPVLASCAGALPEAVGEGGTCLALPDNVGNEGVAGWSEADIEPWIERLTCLWRESEHYREQVLRARQQAGRYDLAARVEAVAARIECLQAGRPVS